MKDNIVKHLNIQDDAGTFSHKAKNPGLYLDNKLSIESRVGHLCNLVYLELRIAGAMTKIPNKT